ncbi:MAG: oligosaccharide flippase family protein [Chloroflexota bacterium]
MLTTAATVALRPINLAASFLLLRWLSPEEFGSVALAMILFQTSNLFTGLGLGSALIHTQLDRKKVAFYTFSMMMAFALVLFVVVNLFLENIAGLIAKPEDVAGLLPIMRPLSFLILINTASTIPTSILKKDLLFGRVSTFNLIQQLTYTFVALGFAISGFGVWSLVIARLSSSSIKTISSWLMCPGWDWITPKRWDLGISRELLTYGLPNMWGGLLNYFHTHWDDLLVGRVFGEAILGFYTKAYDLTNSTIKQFSDNVIGAVFFPSYAKIQDDPIRLSRIYIKSVQLVMLIVVPLAFGAMSVAPELVRVLWGADWIPMIPILQVYGFMLLSRPVSTNTSPLFLALGKPNFNARAGYVLLFVMLPLAFLLLDLGVMGIAYAVVASHFVGAVFNVYQVNTLLPGSARKTARAIFPTVMAGIMMYLVVILFKQPLLSIWGEQYGFSGLFSLIILGGLVYTPIVFVIQWSLIQEILQLIRPMLEKRVPFLRRSVAEKQAV